MCYVDRKVPAPGGGAKPSKSALLSKLVIKTGMTVAVVPLAYAVCSALAALGICYPEVAVGQVNAISQNENVQLFHLTSLESYSIFSTDLDISLRPPCPSCHPSYDHILHENQFILPSTGMVTFFTFLSEEPYVHTQVLQTPNCEPLSIFKSSLSPSLLYLDCQDLENKGNYFLALLERFPGVGGGEGEYIWIYSTLIGFESLEQAGSYAEFMASGSAMMLYVHEVQDYLELNGLLTGYFSILSKPEECTNVVRITATGNSEDKLLLECSTSQSDLVSVIHIFDSLTSRHLLTTTPYPVCPIRSSVDGSIVAIFTNLSIFVIDLSSESYVNMSVSHPIYDGVITQSDSFTFCLVYSTSDGLHRAQISLTTSKQERRLSIGSESMFPDTDSICVEDGCPLLYLVDQDLILAALHFSMIALFSISNLERVAPDIEIEYHPSRFMFQPANISISSVSTCVCLTQSLLPSPEAKLPGSVENPIMKQTDDVSTTTTIAAVIIVAFTVAGVTILRIVIVVRKRKLSYSNRARYERSSDRVQLIDCKSQPISSGSSDLAAKPPVDHSADSGIADTNDDNDGFVSGEQFSNKPTDNDQGMIESDGPTIAKEQENTTNSPASVLHGQKIIAEEQKDILSSRAIIEVQRVKKPTVISRLLPWRARNDKLHIHAQEEQHDEVMENKHFVLSFPPPKHSEKTEPQLQCVFNNHLTTQQ